MFLFRFFSIISNYKILSIIPLLKHSFPLAFMTPHSWHSYLSGSFANSFLLSPLLTQSTPLHVAPWGSSLCRWIPILDTGPDLSLDWQPGYQISQKFQTHVSVAKAISSPHPRSCSCPVFCVLIVAPLHPVRQARNFTVVLALSFSLFSPIPSISNSSWFYFLRIYWIQLCFLTSMPPHLFRSLYFLQRLLWKVP